MAKSKKVKLPKRVGGVKIPKELRKGGERLIEQVQTDVGRAALARGAATVAGIAAAAVQSAAARRAAGAAPVDAAAPPAASEPAAERPAKPDPLVDAIGAGVEAVLGKLLTRR